MSLALTPAVLGRNARRTALGLAASRRTAPIPDELHPVAWFGVVMTAVERWLWRDARGAGVAHAAIGTALGVAAGAVIDTTAAVTLTAAGAQLRDTASAIADQLDAGDLAGARAALPQLVGRDPTTLDASGIAAAVIESVAENMVDAVYAPALAALAAGAPGATTYRAINTMDAMVGRRDERYGRYGWAAARLDDVCNLVPARVFALAVAAVRPDRAAWVWRVVRRDARHHPSPNAGVAEAAMAAVLDREVGGPLVYGTVAEDRPRLGDGPRPGPGDVRAAVAVAEDTERLLIATLAVLGVGLGLATGTLLP